MIYILCFADLVQSSNSGTLSTSGNQEHYILRIGDRRILNCQSTACRYGGSPTYGTTTGGAYPWYRGGGNPWYGGGQNPWYGGGGYPWYGGGGYPYRPPMSVDEKKEKRSEKEAKQVEVHN